MANNSFTPSATVTNYQKKAQEYEKAVQQALARLQNSPLGVDVQDALNRVTNRIPFSYNVNADGLYQQYKQQYQTLGQNAMKETVARAAEKTGGFANSYGVTAGAQAYNGYMQQLSGKIPDLYQLALDRYNNETNRLQKEYELLANRQAEEYEKGQNEVDALWQLAEYYTTLGNNQLAHETNLWEQALEQAYRQQQLEYQKGRDAVEDAQWAKEYALSLQKAQTTQTKSTTKNTSQVTDSSQWDAARWEEYFAGLRLKYGANRALEMMQTLARSGALPADMITYARIGAQGGMSGH